MIDLQTTVTFPDRHTLADFRAIKYNFDNILGRQCVVVDPISQIPVVEVYTDDGQGNGNLLYRFELN